MTPFAILLVAAIQLAPASACAKAQGPADLSAFVAGHALPGVVVTGEEHRIDAPRDATVATVRVHEGQLVRRGERLVDLSGTTSDGATLEVARSQREAAEAGIREAQAETIRLQSELQRRQHFPNLFAREQIDASVAQLHEAQARLDAARAELAARRSGESSAAAALQSLQVDAPADLRVQRVLVVAGARVAAGTALLELVGDGTAAVRFAWPLQDAPASMVGRTVCVRPTASRDAAAVPAQVFERSREPDSAAQAWIGEGRFDSPPSWAQSGVAVDVIVMGDE